MARSLLFALWILVGIVHAAWAQTDPDCHLSPDPTSISTVSWPALAYQTIQVDANGRVAFLEGDEEAFELWLDAWVVTDIIGSVLHLAHQELPPSSDPGAAETAPTFTVPCPRTPSGVGRFTVVVNDVLDTELGALTRWLRSRRGPIWVTGPGCPEICDPEHRRRLGLDAQQPPWCDGRRPADCPFTVPGDSDPRRIWMHEELRRRLRTLPESLRPPEE